MIPLTSKQIDDINDDIDQIYHLGKINEEDDATEFNVRQLMMNCENLAEKLKEILEDKDV